MRFAICNEIFNGWSPAEAAAFAAGAGYDGIEIAPFTLAPDVTRVDAAERLRLRQAAERAGIAITGIHWVLAHTEGLHLTSPDPAVRQRTAEYLVALVDFCADLGGAVMVVGSPKQRSLAAGISPADAQIWARDAFAPAIRAAERRTVTVCFEPLAPAETNFINTAAEAIAFVAPFQSAAFKIILDVKAMSSEAKSIPQIIADSAPYIGYFHANDRNLKGPGFGEVDFVPIARALRQAGYDGWVSVEVFNFDDGPRVIATQSLAYLRKSFGEAVGTPKP